MKQRRIWRGILLPILLLLTLFFGVGLTGNETVEARSRKKQTSKQETGWQGDSAKDHKETRDQGHAKDGTLSVEEDECYTSKEEVALYLHTFDHLPDNFITKEEAKDLGWISREGNLHEVAPGMSIGGDYFGNYEQLLPTKKGRKYYECDIDYEKGYRNEKRIIFSNDGLIYYTEDHYETFEQLY